MSVINHSIPPGYGSRAVSGPLIELAGNRIAVVLREVRLGMTRAEELALERHHPSDGIVGS